VTGVDLGLAALVALGALWGLAVGAVKQLVQFLAWVAAMVAPWFCAAPLAHLLEGPLGVPFPVAYAFSAVSSSVVAWVVVRLLLWLPTRDRRKKEADAGSTLGALNRTFGALFGAAKMAFVLWLVLSAVALISSPFEVRGVKLRYADAELYRFVQTHNALEYAFHDRVESLQQAVRRARAPKSGKNGPAVADELLKDPRVQAIAKDDALRQALERGDVTALVRSPPMMSLLADRALLEKVVATVGAAGGDIHAATAAP
jgi:uncharacterized membrane protein required for colicin V production